MMDYADLYRLLTSRDHLNDDGEPLTVVDGLFAIAESIDRLAEAIETSDRSEVPELVP